MNTFFNAIEFINIFFYEFADLFHSKVIRKLMFSSSIFIFHIFTSKPLILFEFTIVYNVTNGSNFKEEFISVSQF